MIEASTKYLLTDSNNEFEYGQGKSLQFKYSLQLSTLWARIIEVFDKML